MAINGRYEGRNWKWKNGSTLSGDKNQLSCYKNIKNRNIWQKQATSNIWWDIRTVSACSLLV